MKTGFKEPVKFMSTSDHELLTVFNRTPLQSCEMILRGINRSTGQPVRQARVTRQPLIKVCFPFLHVLELDLSRYDS